MQTYQQKCTFCGSCPETVTHLLCNCQYVVNLWGNLERLIHYYFKVTLKITPAIIIFNNYVGPSCETVNLCIAIMKQFIYAQKCFGEIPKFMGFMNKLSNWYNIEKQFTYLQGSENKIKKFYGKLERNVLK